jgi:hypothetical protein
MRSDVMGDETQVAGTSGRKYLGDEAGAWGDEARRGKGRGVMRRKEAEVAA